MESDLHHRRHHLADHQPLYDQKPMNSGLTRYQSAPSSYFSSFSDRDFCEEFLNRPTSPETERIFARFLSATSGNTDNAILDQSFRDIRDSSSVKEPVREMEPQTQIMATIKTETEVLQKQNSYSSVSQSFYQTHQAQNQQQLPNQNSGSGMDYRMETTMRMDRLPPTKTGGGNSTPNLIRHSSSPAGLFANINIDNRFGVLRGMGDFGSGNKRESSFTSAIRPPSSSSGLMQTITEMGEKNMGGNSPENAGLYTVGSWDEVAILSDEIAGVKRIRDDDKALTKNVEAASMRPPLLAHHLSLPKSSAEISAIEKFFQDSVPCKIRAKRGCATHPRSIAERVRRTRISERMRKLQDLVPNMDKQTNTADMLDLAVDYIKDLQKQVKTLSDNRAKCLCSNKQQQK